MFKCWTTTEANAHACSRAVQWNGPPARDAVFFMSARHSPWNGSAAPAPIPSGVDMRTNDQSSSFNRMFRNMIS